MTSRAKTSARLLGAAIGLAGAAAIVVSGLTPQSHAGLGGARLTIAAESTPELAVAPTGRFFSATNLRPVGRRGAVGGVVRLTNLTAGELTVRVKVMGPPRSLGDLLRASVLAGDRPLVSGSLARLHQWSARGFRLLPGDPQPLEVRAWLPRSAGDGYAARSADLTLAFSTELEGADGD